MHEEVQHAQARGTAIYCSKFRQSNLWIAAEMIGVKATNGLRSP